MRGNAHLLLRYSYDTTKALYNVFVPVCPNSFGVVGVWRTPRSTALEYATGRASGVRARAGCKSRD